MQFDGILGRLNSLLILRHINFGMEGFTEQFIRQKEFANYICISNNSLIKL